MDRATQEQQSTTSAARPAHDAMRPVRAACTAGKQLADSGLSTDRLYGHIKWRKTGTDFLAFHRYLRSLHPPEVRITIVLDNFSPHRSTKTDTRVGDGGPVDNVELVHVPFYGTHHSRIGAQSTGTRCCALDGTDHNSHREQASLFRRDIVWRDSHLTDPRLGKVVERAAVIERAKAPDAVIAR